MKTGKKDDLSLTTRIEAQERRHNILRWQILGLATFCGSLLLFSQSRSVSRTLEAEEFRLLNSKGEALGALLATPNGLPGLLLQGPGGTPSIGLAIAEDGTTAMQLQDTEGNVRASIGLSADGTPILVFADDQGVPRALLAGTPQLSLNDGDGQSRVILRHDSERGGEILLVDASQKTGVAIVDRDEDGSSVAVLGSRGQTIMNALDEAPLGMAIIDSTGIFRVQMFLAVEGFSGIILTDDTDKDVWQAR